MKLKNVLVVVDDMEESVRFYQASGTRMRILTRCLWSGILTKRQDAALISII